MNYQQLLDGMKRYRINEADMCMHYLGVGQEQIAEQVIIAPWWEPQSLAQLGDAEYLSPSPFSAIKVWKIKSKVGDITYIKTGIGAPVLMDALLALGITRCKHVIFVGSVGSLDETIGIGDIVIPQYSICGDGASRYLAGDALGEQDVFGTRTQPDGAMFDAAWKIAGEACGRAGVKLHMGRVFSIDSIFAQYAHIDAILKLGCNTIEMETASAFRAAKIAGLKIAAILSVSDNTVTNQSLVSGRTEADEQYRRAVRRTLLPDILLQCFRACNK